jgi:hypothetical protein
VVGRGRFCRLEANQRDGASRFVAGDFEPIGSLMSARRRVTPAAGGGAHGPAHGSSSVTSARIVRDDEVQSTASDRDLRPPCADAAAQESATGGAPQPKTQATAGSGGRP